MSPGKTVMGCGGSGGTKGKGGSRVWKEKGPEEKVSHPNSHFPPRSKKDANTAARWGHWPAGDTPSVFAGGWAVSQGGSQWERRRWLYQPMLKKSRGSCLYSHLIPSALPPPAASPLHLRLPSKSPRVFGGTDSPSSVTWHQGHQPLLDAGQKTQAMASPAPPPPVTTPRTLGCLPKSHGDSHLSGVFSPPRWGV